MTNPTDAKATANCTESGWRVHLDLLTPQQMRHLAAVEELAVRTLQTGNLQAEKAAHRV